MGQKSGLCESPERMSSNRITSSFSMGQDHKSGLCQSPERMSSNGIMSSSSMGQDTHSPLPSSLISLPPSVGDLSSQGQKTCMDGLPLWQNLCPFHRSSPKLQKIAGEGRARALSQIALPVPQHGFLNAFEGLWKNPTCIPRFCPDPGQERCGV